MGPRMLVFRKPGGVTGGGTTRRHTGSRRSRFWTIHRGSADGDHRFRRQVSPRPRQSRHRALQFRRVPARLRRSLAAEHAVLRRRAVSSRTAGARRSSCASPTARAAARSRCRPASRSWCCAALAPGTREFLRAAVDYDGIGDNEDDCFNLVLQRVRTPGSEHIEDQEIFRRAVAARGQQPQCRGRARRFGTRAGRRRPAGLAPGPDAPRRSARHRRLRALRSGRATTARRSPTTTSSARRRRAPACSRSTRRTRSTSCAFRRSRATSTSARARCWSPTATAANAARSCSSIRRSPGTQAAKALAEMRDWPLPCGLGLPLLPAPARLRQAARTLRGLRALRRGRRHVARRDELWPVWSAAAGDETVLRPGLRAACAVDEDYRARLAACGVNTVQTVRRPRPRVAARLHAGRPGRGLGGLALAVRAAARALDHQQHRTRHALDAVRAERGADLAARRGAGPRLPGLAGGTRRLRASRAR